MGARHGTSYAASEARGLYTRTRSWRVALGAGGGATSVDTAGTYSATTTFGEFVARTRKASYITSTAGGARLALAVASSLYAGLSQCTARSR